MFCGSTLTSAIKKSISWLLLLLILVELFEVLPAVDQARAMFPADFNSSYTCQTALESRPWYGQIKTWLWFFLLLPPLVIFSFKPDTPAWQRSVKALLIICATYVAGNLGAHQVMDIKNAPFRDFDMSDFSDIANFKRRCTDIADGAKYIFALYFGWVYGLIYTGWWEIIWVIYHRKITKQIDRNFKIDFITPIVIFFSIAIPVFILSWIAWRMISA